MSEQLSLAEAPRLPAVFVDAFARRCGDAGRRTPVLACGSAYQVRGQWWLEVIVDGREHFALLGRADLEAAAGDLFTRVFGTHTGAP